MSYPLGVAVDSSGNIFIADTTNNVVRKVSVAGVITTIAGRFGQVGYAGDGGPASASLLWTPSGVAVDAAGDVFIADTVNNVIREISVGTGNISTVAGNTTQGFAGDGGAATSANLYLPKGVFVDGSGNIFIADTGNNRIRKVSGGNISTVAGNGTAGYSGDGGPATNAWLYNPTNVAVDASGNIFIAVTLSNRIREVSAATGNISTVAGDGPAGFFGDGAAANFALLNHPAGVAVDTSGDIFIADTVNNRVREASASTVPAPAITPSGIVPVYSTSTNIQPGEWISIYGTNLGPSSPATWNGNFPTLLGGTSVTIDGIAAYLWFVSSTQINLQVPDDANTGRPVSVVVTTGAGNTSSSVNLATVAPSFSLLGDDKHVAGIIARTDGSGTHGAGAASYDIIGPTGSSLGYATVAAKAGDNIQLYGVGFGPTSPAAPAGQVLSGNPQTTNAVSLSINNKSVVTGFTGLSEAGLYQINVNVPAGLGTGDVPLVATVDGAQTQLGVVISLQ